MDEMKYKWVTFVGLKTQSTKNHAIRPGSTITLCGKQIDARMQMLENVIERNVCQNCNRVASPAGTKNPTRTLVRMVDVRKISREEVSDAIASFLAKGGEIRRQPPSADARKINMWSTKTANGMWAPSELENGWTP